MQSLTQNFLDSYALLNIKAIVIERGSGEKLIVCREDEHSFRINKYKANYCKSWFEAKRIRHTRFNELFWPKTAHIFTCY